MTEEPVLIIFKKLAKVIIIFNVVNKQLFTYLIKGVMQHEEIMDSNAGAAYADLERVRQQQRD